MTKASAANDFSSSTSTTTKTTVSTISRKPSVGGASVGVLAGVFSRAGASWAARVDRTSSPGMPKSHKKTADFQAGLPGVMRRPMSRLNQWRYSRAIKRPNDSKASRAKGTAWPPTPQGPVTNKLRLSTPQPQASTRMAPRSQPAISWISDRPSSPPTTTERPPGRTRGVRPSRRTREPLKATPSNSPPPSMRISVLVVFGQRKRKIQMKLRRNPRARPTTPPRTAWSTERSSPWAMSDGEASSASAGAVVTPWAEDGAAFAAVVTACGRSGEVGGRLSSAMRHHEETGNGSARGEGERREGHTPGGGGVAPAGGVGVACGAGPAPQATPSRPMNAPAVILNTVSHAVESCTWAGVGSFGAANAIATMPTNVRKQRTEFTQISSLKSGLMETIGGFWRATATLPALGLPDNLARGEVDDRR